MLVKNSRISKKKEFDDIFKKGKSTRGTFFILKFLKNDLKLNRFAFMVSKKISLKAVVRNKIRRRLSEAVKEFRTESDKGVDVVFLTLPAIKDKSFSEIKTETDKFLEKIISKNKDFK